jgi:hypothetical protein
MSDVDAFTPEVIAEEPAPKRKRTVKAKAEDAGGGKSGVRDWKEVVAQIRALKDQGVTVPQIAEQLQLSYVLVNQVMLQSYKMTVDTLGVFERQEKARLGIED